MQMRSLEKVVGAAEFGSASQRPVRIAESTRHASLVIKKKKYIKKKRAKRVSTQILASRERSLVRG